MLERNIGLILDFKNLIASVFIQYRYTRSLLAIVKYIGNRLIRNCASLAIANTISSLIINIANISNLIRY